MRSIVGESGETLGMGGSLPGYPGPVALSALIGERIYDEHMRAAGGKFFLIPDYVRDSRLKQLYFLFYFLFSHLLTCFLIFSSRADPNDEEGCTSCRSFPPRMHCCRERR